MLYDWYWIIIVSEGVYKVCGVYKFVFLVEAFIVYSFNFISNVICFGTEFKCWFEIYKKVFSVFFF